VLFNVTGPREPRLHELNAAARVIAEVVDPRRRYLRHGRRRDAAGRGAHHRHRHRLQPAHANLAALPVDEAVTAEPKPIRLADIQPEPSLDQLTEADLPTFLRRTFPSR